MCYFMEETRDGGKLVWISWCFISILLYIYALYHLRSCKLYHPQAYSFEVISFTNSFVTDNIIIIMDIWMMLYYAWGSCLCISILPTLKTKLELDYKYYLLLCTQQPMFFRTKDIINCSFKLGLYGISYWCCLS